MNGAAYRLASGPGRVTGPFAAVLHDLVWVSRACIDPASAEPTLPEPYIDLENFLPYLVDQLMARWNAAGIQENNLSLVGQQTGLHLKREAGRIGLSRK